MNCPECSNPDTTVSETRTREDGTKRRRYRCANGHRFTTFESIVGHTSTLANYLSLGQRRKIIVAFLARSGEPQRVTAIVNEIKALTGRAPGRDTIAHDLSVLESERTVVRKTKPRHHGWFFTLAPGYKPQP